MLIASSTISSLACKDNAGQMLSILGENVLICERMCVYSIQSQIISFKKPFAKLSTRLELKLMLGILNLTIVLAAKAVR